MKSQRSHFEAQCLGNIWIYAPGERILMVVDVIFPGWVPFRRLAVVGGRRRLDKGEPMSR